MDPFERLSDAADRVGKRAQKEAQRADYESANRRALLWIHTVVGVTAGAQMWMFGSATVIENAVGVWVRMVLAGLATVGGLLLGWGLLKRPRSIPREALGLLLLCIWDVCMVVGLAVARYQQHDFRIRPVTEPLPEGYVTAYPLAVYAGYVALLIFHLVTLRRLKRSGLKGNGHADSR